MSRTRLASFSRRSFLRFSAAASAAAAFHNFSEPMLAAAVRGPVPKDAVVIDANENPLGPSQGARDAAAAMVPLGGRYSGNLTDELVQTFAQMEGLSPDWIQPFPGSTGPLRGCVLAFTSAQKSYVTADPCFELGMYVAEKSGARVVKVPLTKTYAHDVKAMIAAGPDGGMFYVCSPNNPTGTLTSHSDIEYLVENKPKGAVVVIDEAYIHLSDGPAALDLVKAGKDVVVLRTFSKVYGMAGLRCGFAIARPELLARVGEYGGYTFMPITAVVAATASLKDAQLVPERKRINASVRQATFEWLERNGYFYIPSEANHFMIDTKRPGKEVREAMAKQNVFIGRTWPIWPTYVRVTVGTHDEMERFQNAFQKVMSGRATILAPGTLRG
jgi:histidinol-phosphate aminotransferase